ncbi:ABC transporter substrate-binding protein [Corynebacterium spheniscorum]|uniref:Peptide/nickel transport system substrate-binding protein n=1 Tax=Corynebacterium spheniscorum TaxID=185761 RepID=A0A1I2TCE5_9CORY|nr:ABC transporter substrate-binding protein [Corynebacterium spheniscorum]KAA8721284.1 ABC transporter substrate-binding protein [Corynebacterium spheniscorum]SFG60977.1 peptide/nickel transport system substrate-binding protein [Corynebacterium spheniscorum]
MSLGSVSRRQFLRLTGVIAGAAGLSAAVAACAPDNPNKTGGSTESGSGAAAGSENKDGSIKAAISYELGTNGYDPMTTTSALTIAANWHTLEGLTEMDPASGKTYAALAAELPKSEGTEIDVKLRKDATFHNGEKVTVEDVIYSFERVLDPANKSLYASFIPFIDKVEKKDDDTVTFKLSYPVGVFADRLSAVKVVPKAAVEANPKGFDANPVGTGPWKMTDNGGSSKTVKFERFEDYTGPKPARAKTMEWQIIPDSSTRINSLQSGQTQAIDSVPYLNIDQLKATNTVDSIQGFGLLFAMFNCDPGNPFNDVRNRQAFLYAVDIDKVVETGLSGQASPATSFLQESHPNYHKAEVVYTHDEAKAKELFGQTGLKKLRMLCTDHDWVRKCTPLIQESLGAIGIDVDFTERKSSDVYNTIDGKPEAYDVVIAPGDPSVFGNDPDLLMRWWYGGDTWTETRMHWKGQDSYEEVQELLDAGLKATDATSQQDNWNRTFDAISRNVPLYPLFHRKTPSAWDAKTLIDFEPISLTGLSFVDVGTTLS